MHTERHHLLDAGAPVAPMATRTDVRRIARTLPGIIESTDDFAFAVQAGAKAKGVAWSWKERLEPGKPRVPSTKVLAIRTANVAERDALIAYEPAKFFTEPHYNNYPAVLVRLEAVTSADLRALLEGAWQCVAPASLRRAHRKP